MCFLHFFGTILLFVDENILNSFLQKKCKFKLNNCNFNFNKVYLPLRSAEKSVSY